MVDTWFETEFGTIGFGGLFDMPFVHQHYRHIPTAVLNVGVANAPRQGRPDTWPYRETYFHDHDPFPLDLFWDNIKWIDEHLSQYKYQVFVHCHEGNSRSLSTVLAYMTWKGVDFDAAAKLLLDARPTAQLSGKPVNEPLQIRHWFKRDWPAYLERKRNGA